MPPSLRRRAPAPTIPSSEEPYSESEDEYAEATFEEDPSMDVATRDPEDLEGEEEELEEELASDSEPLDTPSLPQSSAPPPHFRDISTLASWTASSSKPGCSIPQLRHPSTALFWQSDGPQPHYLNIHFFKLVRIVGLRLYLDFEADESYTPTRIVLLAGSGMNDLVEWGEMRLESPRGWVWADFEGVGEADSDESGSSEEDEDEDPGPYEHAGPRTHVDMGLPMAPPAPTNDTSDSENAAPPIRTQATTPAPVPLTPDPMLLDPPIPHQTPQLQVPHLTASNTPTLPFPIARPHPRQPFTSLSTNTSPQPLPRRARKAKTPVLRCHLVQIKILENHQNGKDTHLRGLQIFARDNEKEGKKNMVSIGTGVRIPKGLHYKGDGTVMKVEHDGQEKRRMGGLTRSDWMGEATIR